MTQHTDDAPDTAVIVPVVGRPGSAWPFMESFRAATPAGARVYAVCEEGDPDTLSAWLAAGANVLTAPGSTFAIKVNHGYRHTGEPWLFVVGDDVRFRSGWLNNAKLVAGRRWHVVGVNDKANPRVMAGEHATHMLIRRSYVDEVGASWDGPGSVCHEGYGHWYVDDEIVAAAKQRGVWTPAKSSVVEHLHPMFGRGEWDDIYERGTKTVEADRALFEARLREHLAGVS